MTDPQPQDPRAYQAWLQQLEQQWQAGLIPDPQAVAVIVLNHHGDVLLQLRDNNPHIAFANCWTLPGGVVEAHETPEQAARRELAEETGLSLDVSLWTMYRRESKKYTFLIEQYVYISHTRYPVNQMIVGEGQALHFLPSTIFLCYQLPMVLRCCCTHSSLAESRLTPRIWMARILAFFAWVPNARHCSFFLFPYVSPLRRCEHSYASDGLGSDHDCLERRATQSPWSNSATKAPSLFGREV